MNNYKGLTILVLVLNTCTVIGAGHGIIPFGVIEFFWLYSLLDFGMNSLSPGSSIILVTLAGQFFLIAALSMKVRYAIRRAQIIGTVLLLFGFILVLGSRVNETGLLNFILGIPFIYISLKLMYRLSEN